MIRRARAFYAEIGRSERLTGYDGFTNQFGHAMLGLFAAWLLIVFFGIAAFKAYVIIGAVYFIWEATQKMPQEWSAVSDLATDWGFVMAGALLLMLGGLWAIPVAAVLAGAFGIITQPLSE